MQMFCVFGLFWVPCCLAVRLGEWVDARDDRPTSFHRGNEGNVWAGLGSRTRDSDDAFPRPR